MMGCCPSAESSTTRKIVQYEIIVFTSDAFKDAGSDSCIYIELVGEDNTSSGWKKLDELFRDDFERGSRDVFYIETLDVGMPLFIRLELRDRKKDAWACDEVIISYQGADVSFPVYDWIEDSTAVARGKALTFTQANVALRAMRSNETDRARARYQWVARPTVSDMGWGIPRYVNSDSYEELPKIFKQTTQRVETFEETGFEGFVNAASVTVKNFLSGLNNLDDFKRLYKHLNNDDDPPFIDRWDTDVEFGRQQIMGVTPLVLKKCQSLPDCCGITDSHVCGALGNTTLQEQMDQGRIFIGDYSKVFQGVSRNTNSSGDLLYCPDAIGVFFVNGSNDLVPIAIQLIPDDSESIFTSTDDHYDWLLAKMYYRVAAANLHQWYFHFLLTHNVMEPFSVSLFRCLPRSHPIYKLLRPHLQTVSAINTRARTTLLGPKTQANNALALAALEQARASFKTFKIQDLIFPEVLKERGLDDCSILPKNYFRDDALKLWEIIKEFVADIIKIYYKCDGDVQADDEVQAFAKDVATEGLGWEDGNTRGMPETIESVDQLILICTVLIYTSSVNHASVNFPQYQNYQYIPNAPAAMRLPPHKKGEGTMERIMNSLPDLNMATIQVTIPYVLSFYSPDEVYLGEYPMHLFTDHQALAAIEKYGCKLSKYFDEVDERNKGAGDDAYTWLGRNKVPNSIAV